MYNSISRRYLGQEQVEEIEDVLPVLKMFKVHL